MDQAELQAFIEFRFKKDKESFDGIIKPVSLESEIPEALYQGIKEFVCSNPQWNNYRLFNSAIANFLFQNGSEE